MRLAVDGFDVACTATTLVAAVLAAEEIEAATGQRTLGVQMRVEDRDSVEAGFAETASRLGSVDVLVANAGISGVAPFLEMEAADFASVVDINLTGVFHTAQVAAAGMVAAGNSGVIITMGSIAGRTAFPNRAGYCSTKAAVHQLTRVMALDLAAHGIRVNGVAPGYIRTDMVQNLINEGTLDETILRNRVPQGDLGQVADIANAVSWLVSDQSSYVTGETLAVDGGWLSYGHV